MPTRVVDRIRFLRADGSDDHFARDDKGRLSGHQFQGRSSVRALVDGGAEELGQVIRAGLSPPAGETVPPERLHIEGFDIAPGGARQAWRAEAKLQTAFAEYLRTKGDEIVSKKISIPGEAGSLHCDLYNASRSQLIEAKANTARDSLRMALGQLLDYGRFISGTERAVLLPERPSEDLLALLNTQGISAIWATARGFVDNTGGRFT